MQRFYSIGSILRIKFKTLKPFLQSYGVPKFSDLYPSKWIWSSIHDRVFSEKRESGYNIASTLTVLQPRLGLGKKDAKAAFEEMFRPEGGSAEITLLVLPDCGTAGGTTIMSDARHVTLAAIISRCMDALLVYCLVLKLSIVVGGGGGGEMNDEIPLAAVFQHLEFRPWITTGDTGHLSKCLS